MSCSTYKCPYCDHKPYETSRQLCQHLQKNPRCSKLRELANKGDEGYSTAQEYMHFYPIKNPTTGPNKGVDHNLYCQPTRVLGAKRTCTAAFQGDETVTNDIDLSGYHTAMQDQMDHDLPTTWDDNEEEQQQRGQDGYNLSPENEAELEHLLNSVRSDYREYCARAQGFAPWTKRMKEAVALMRKLRATKASLETYDIVMEWHLRATGAIPEHMSAKKSPLFISRKAIFKFLRKRYNMDTGYNNITTIVLPSSANRAKIVWNRAHKVIQRLLTDPRIRTKDYLFWGNDPFAPPPRKLNYIADLNTGKSYIDTWKALIKKPGKQILLPTPIYIDGTATGQFADLPITPVKISLGIFNREARDKAHFWGILGLIPHVSYSSSRGKRILIDSGHVDGTVAYQQSVRNEGVLKGQQAPKAQDLHSILDVIFKDYTMLQKSGINWDLFYDDNLYEDVELIPFVPFIKADTDEAEKLCGKFTSRGINVSQICRYCTCPTEESDQPMANYPLKTKNRIQSLVDRGEVEELRKLSQHCIQNALYKVRFGSHNKLSVHGACAWDMLHMILLGIFKYVRDCFFEQIGDKSQLAKEIDALARQFGELLSRQSDRNLPKTKFNNGIIGGKLTAKEYTGVLLILLTLLKSKEGRKLARKKGLFKKDQVIYDWCLLLETLLTWEAWLKSASMELKHVRKAEQKHRYLMYMIKKVGNRSKGMGLKVTKFHAIMHLVQDMKNFGVPLEVDCGSNEQHHDTTKTSAKLTQKKKDTFDQSTAQRLQEMDLLEMAKQEYEGRPLWSYHEGYHHEVQKEAPEKPPVTGGAAYRCLRHPETGHISFSHVRRIGGKSRRIMVEQPFVNFVAGLEDATENYINDLMVLTYHKRNGQIFRGDMSFMGSVWRDWVIVDWGKEDGGELPCKIWGFVDLSDLPVDSNITYGGITSLTPGVYAIVESTTLVNEGKSVASGYIDLDADSEMACYIETEVGHMTNGFVDELTFYLADVEAFVEPAVAVPDIGGKNNGYIWLDNREYWAGKFEDWLDSDPKYDVMHESDDEESGEEEDDDIVEEAMSSSEEELSDTEESHNSGVESQDDEESGDESQSQDESDSEQESSDCGDDE